MMDERKTFGELGHTVEPHVDAYKAAHGRYPILEVEKPVKLPTRYKAPGGVEKYHMKTTYRPGEALQVIGTEPAKRRKDAVNVIIKHPTDPDSQIVLTPADLFKKMVVRTPTREDVARASTPGDELDAFVPPKPTYNADVKAVLEQRKREAKISI